MIVVLQDQFRNRTVHAALQAALNAAAIAGRRNLAGLGATCRALTSGGVPTGKCMDVGTGYIGPCDATGCPSGTSYAPQTVQAQQQGTTYATYNTAPVTMITSASQVPMVDTQVAGFQGTISVPALEARLADDLSSLTSPFNNNAVITGQMTTQTVLQTLQGTIKMYCGLYPATCSPYSSDQLYMLAQQVANRWQMWAQNVIADYQSKVARGAINPIAGALPAAPVPSGGGSVTAYPQPSGGASYGQVPIPNQGSTGGGGATAAPSPSSTNVGVTATLNNASRPNMPLAAGDNFQLVIQGPPNTPVTISAQQNGQSLGTTPFGSTNGAGQLVISGLLDSTHQGTWSETVHAGTAATTMNFTVGAAPSAGTGGGAPTGQPQSSNAGGFFDNTTGGSGAGSGGNVLTGGSSIGLPNWAIYAGLGLAAVVFLKK